MTKIRNLTGQDLTLYVENDPITTIHPEGKVWVRANYEFVGHITVDGVPVPVLTTTASEEIDGLPPFEEGTFLIVTGLVASLLPMRGDLLAPAKIVRAKSPDGQRRESIGCRAFMSHSTNYAHEEEQDVYNRR